MPSRRALVIALHRLDRSALPLYAWADLEAEVLELLSRLEDAPTSGIRRIDDR